MSKDDLIRRAMREALAEQANEDQRSPTQRMAEGYADNDRRVEQANPKTSKEARHIRMAGPDRDAA